MASVCKTEKSEERSVAVGGWMNGEGEEIM